MRLIILLAVLFPSIAMAVDIREHATVAVEGEWYLTRLVAYGSRRKFEAECNKWQDSQFCVDAASFEVMGRNEEGQWICERHTMRAGHIWRKYTNDAGHAILHCDYGEFHD